MTAEEMQYHFELKTGQFNSIDKIFTSTDIAVLLNEAQRQAVEARYDKNIAPRGWSFEANEKVRTELGNLVNSYNATAGVFDTTSEALNENGVFVALPADYLYAIKESVVISYTNCNSESVTSTAKVLPIRHDEYEANINNPFAKPYEKLVWRMDYGATGSKKHEIICGDSNSVVSYNLRYLKTPRSIDIINGVDCELHENIHEEIVDRAIQLSARIYNKPNINQTQEL